MQKFSMKFTLQRLFFATKLTKPFCLQSKGMYINNGSVWSCWLDSINLLQLHTPHSSIFHVYVFTIVLTSHTVRHNRKQTWNFYANSTKRKVKKLTLLLPSPWLKNNRELKLQNSSVDFHAQLLSQTNSPQNKNICAATLSKEIMPTEREQRKHRTANFLAGHQF